MKYIIIGLGYFGTSLATRLVSMGHEVIGVDHLRERAEELKEKLSKVLIMDSTKLEALQSLPLSDVDAVIVAIGEDIGSSILTLSILKKLKIKRLIGRAINPMHQSILNELGIEEIVHPEVDSAEIVSSILMMKDAINILQVNDTNAIVELKVPEKYAGHSLEAMNLEERFDIKLIAVKIAPKENTGLTKFLQKDFVIDKTCDRLRPLRTNDRLLLIGEVVNIKRFIE